MWHREGRYYPIAERLFAGLAGNDFSEADQWRKLELALQTAQRIWSE